jgi:adenylylsulfate kinase
VSRTIWFTGLPGAGKSTLARSLEQSLISRGHACAVLDGDELRQGLCRNLGYSPADRSENIRRTAEAARLLNNAGAFAIVALISPLAADRAQARIIVGKLVMFEVYVATSLETCEARDPKGLYARARRGEIPDFTGVSAPYEPPEDPELRLDTSALSTTACLGRILPLLFP